MRTRHTIMCLVLLAVRGAFAAPADDLLITLEVGKKGDRVTFTVTVKNKTDERIDLMPRFDGTNVVSSSLQWKVSGRPAEFLPKRAFRMSPLLDARILPPHSVSVVLLVEDDELFFISGTTNAQTRTAHAALPDSGQYKIEVTTAGDWGGHSPVSATATVRIDKKTPAGPPRPGGSGK